jgi:hypothetical protein
MESHFKNHFGFHVGFEPVDNFLKNRPIFKGCEKCKSSFENAVSLMEKRF